MLVGDVELGGWAVAGFFAISGWLITGSRMRLPLGDYLWRRSLRILPAFWVSLVLTAAVLAPLTAWLGPGRFDPGAAWGFVWKNLLLHVVQPTIPGSLDGLPYTARWNLSLWTLQWEFLCYLGVGILLVSGWVRARRWVLLVVLGAVTVPYAVTVALDVSTGPGFAQGSRLGGCFLVGAVAYAYRDRIPVSGWLAAAAAVVLVLFAQLGIVRGWGAVPLGYLTLWLGASPRLQTVGRRNDISYGVYVYAFPVQLVLTALGAASLGLVAYTVLGVLAVLPIAWLSWLLVERPALRLKAFVPPVLRGPPHRRPDPQR